MTTQEKYAYMKKGFTADQVEEIKLGLEEGLDIELYEKKELYALQMREIRLGLMQELAVDIYARPDFDWLQMEEIRLGLEQNLNVRMYAYPKISFDTMRQLRKALAEGINLSKYAGLPAGVLQELRLAIKEDINIEPYIEQGYDKEQLEQIRIALGNKINIKPYLDINMRGISLSQIRIGLEKNVDVSVYANLEYTWRQMREIRKGMEHQVDVEKFLNPLYDWQQMHEIRLGLEDGLDVSKYSSLMYPATDMAIKRAYLSRGIEDNAVRDVGTPQIISYNNFEIKITPDEMLAYIQIKGKSTGITRSVIRGALEERGIVKGIKEEVIEKIVSGNIDNKPMEIAVGTKPQKGEDGYYEFFFRTDVKREPRVLEDGSLDYQDIEWFEQVKRGDKLAYYHDAGDGEPGYTITGKKINPIKGTQKNILVGQGFYIDTDKHTYIANVDGIITLDGDTLTILNMLTLGDVTAYMGDINFEGNIYITGSVGNGCKIKARDDIIIDGFVEGANLEAGGNICMRRGVNSQGRGTIRAGNRVECAFFENVTVIAGGDVQANYVLSSNISAEGAINISGKKNSIVGGIVYSAREIKVHHVGNAAGVKTILRLGVSDEMIKKQIIVSNEINTVDKELSVLEKAFEEYSAKYSEEARASMDIFRKIEGAIFTKKEMRKKLEVDKETIDAKIETARLAKAVMTGNVGRGVVIEIAGKKWFSTGVRDVTVKSVDGRVVLINN